MKTPIASAEPLATSREVPDLDCALINWLMVGVRQFDQDLVTPGRKAVDNERD